MSTHPSLLMYLFADRFLEPKGWRHVGVAVPCRDVEVRADQLASSMFAAALWSLREAGVLQLELSKRKKMLVMPTTRVAVRLTADPGQRPGLEGAVLEALRKAKPKDDHVDALIRAWFGSDEKDPHSTVSGVEVEEAITQGLIQRVETDAGRGMIVAKLMMGNTKVSLEPQCERIAGLEGASAQFRDRWQRFAADETPLRDTLLAECTSAINTRVESEGPDD